MAKLVLSGLLPVMAVPFGLRPLPHGASGAMDCWEGYRLVGKPQLRGLAPRGPLGVQPIKGSVSRLSEPVARFWSTNWSLADPLGRFCGVATALSMFSKYQSLAWLPMSSCQL